ncbi:MAG: GFA family protein [Verrucomicrobiota bacterium]|nr:GFA family protein [Verrucomicrobiota bacterium]
MSKPIEGGCLCGGVRYRLRREPARLSDCHCIDCRRASAAPFVTWGEIAGEDIEMLSGELRKVHHAGRLRSFAACCGTPLFFQEDEGSPKIEVTILALDRPDKLSPTAAIWTEDRLPWVSLDPARESFLHGRSDAG